MPESQPFVAGELNPQTSGISQADIALRALCERFFPQVQPHAPGMKKIIICPGYPEDDEARLRSSLLPWELPQNHEIYGIITETTAPPDEMVPITTTKVELRVSQGWASDETSHPFRESNTDAWRLAIGVWHALEGRQSRLHLEATTMPDDQTPGFLWSVYSLGRHERHRLRGEEYHGDGLQVLKPDEAHIARFVTAAEVLHCSAT